MSFTNLTLSDKTLNFISWYLSHGQTADEALWEIAKDEIVDLPSWLFE